MSEPCWIPQYNSLFCLLFIIWILSDVSLSCCSGLMKCAKSLSSDRGVYRIRIWICNIPAAHLRLEKVWLVHSFMKLYHCNDCVFYQTVNRNAPIGQNKRAFVIFLTCASQPVCDFVINDMVLLHNCVGCQCIMASDYTQCKHSIFYYVVMIVIDFDICISCCELVNLK